MKRLIKYFAITMLFLSAHIAIAQEGKASNQNDSYQEILKEMPSLDFFGEYTSESEASTFSNLENDVTANNRFYMNVLKEMPSLDFFGEYNNEAFKSEILSSKSFESNNAVDDNFFQEVLKEMPSLDFFIE